MWDFVRYYSIAMNWPEDQVLKDFLATYVECFNKLNPKSPVHVEDIFREIKLFQPFVMGVNYPYGP